MSGLPGLPLDASLQRTSLKDQAVSTLRDYIISGEIRPGTALVERDIAQLLNISRGPSREALLELESQGLVVNSRNRRHVIEPSEAELENMFEVRAPLERRAAERAAENTNAANAKSLLARLAQMEEAVEQRDRSAFVVADLNLHQEIWRQSGNSYLEKVLNDMSGPIFMAIVNGSFKGFDWNQTIELHFNLVEGINSGDVSTSGHVASSNMEDALTRNKTFSAQGETE